MLPLPYHLFISILLYMFRHYYDLGPTKKASQKIRQREKKNDWNEKYVSFTTKHNTFTRLYQLQVNL